MFVPVKSFHTSKSESLLFEKCSLKLHNFTIAIERVQRKGLHYQTFAVKFTVVMYLSYFWFTNRYIFIIFKKELKNHTITSTFELLPRALRMHEWDLAHPHPRSFISFSCPRGSRRMLPKSRTWAEVALEFSKACLYSLCVQIRLKLNFTLRININCHSDPCQIGYLISIK